MANIGIVYLNFADITCYRVKNSVTSRCCTASVKMTPWASQDNTGYPGIGFVDWDNPG